jgi:hypothetical protein
MAKEDSKSIALNNRILEIRIGSHLYGTNTKDSDLDQGGIFIPPKAWILGINKGHNEVSFDIKSKDDGGKNTSEAVDRKFYEYRKYIQMALKNNPNILEYLFVNKDNILFINHYGEELLAHRHLFPYRGLIGNFVGYARSQRHKMIIKLDHYQELCNGYGFLSLVEDKLTMGQVYDRQSELGAKDVTLYKKGTGVHIHIGDICFEPGVYAKKARKMLKHRLDSATSRTELVLKYGYDVKFASHLIRLLKEGLDLLRNGELQFPLSYAAELLDIKNGKYTIDQVIEYSEQLEVEYDKARDKSELPDKPRVKKIEKLAVSQLSEWLNI